MEEATTHQHERSWVRLRRVTDLRSTGAWGAVLWRPDIVEAGRPAENSDWGRCTAEFQKWGRSSGHQTIKSPSNIMHRIIKGITGVLVDLGTNFWDPATRNPLLGRSDPLLLDGYCSIRVKTSEEGHHMKVVQGEEPPYKIWWQGMDRSAPGRVK